MCNPFVPAPRGGLEAGAWLVALTSLFWFRIAKHPEKQWESYLENLGTLMQHKHHWQPGRPAPCLGWTHGVWHSSAPPRSCSRTSPVESCWCCRSTMAWLEGLKGSPGRTYNFSTGVLEWLEHCKWRARGALLHGGTVTQMPGWTVVELCSAHMGAERGSSAELNQAVGNVNQGQRETYFVWWEKWEKQSGKWTHFCVAFVAHVHVLMAGPSAPWCHGPDVHGLRAGNDQRLALTPLSPPSSSRGDERWLLSSDSHCLLLQVHQVRQGLKLVWALMISCPC